MPSRSEQFHQEGFVVLRAEVDVGPLSEEIDQLLDDAFPAGRGSFHHLAQGTGTATFRYAPMMCERTPCSLMLVDHFSPIVEQLSGRPLLPGRAKGTWYQADTGWHRDSRHDIASIGVVTYLEPLDDTSGALRVIPGSHLRPDDPLPEPGAVTGDALATTPGDVIVFDERLIHGTKGGHLRRQWRVDFVIDPRDVIEERQVQAWYAQGIPSEKSDPGYDTTRYPSYGAFWQGWDRPWTQRLRALGVYDLPAR